MCHDKSDDKSGYLEVLPPEHLRDLVDACWFYEPRFSGPTWDILIPEGVVDIIFNFGAPYFRQPAVVSAGPGQWISQDVIVGQRTQLFSVRWPMATQLFALRLKAETAQFFITESLKRVTNQTWPLAFRELSELVHGHPFHHCEAITQQCFRWLTQYFQHRPVPDRRLMTALNLLRDSHGDKDIQSLSTETGLNRRTLERMFSEKLGLSPKLYGRILRLHHFLRCHCPDSSSQLATSAMEAQYYDQSHFIKEFKLFTGESPSAFFQAPPEIYRPLLLSLVSRTKMKA